MCCLTTDAAIAAVTSLIWSDRHVSINVQINLDDMLNKMLSYRRETALQGAL